MDGRPSVLLVDDERSILDALATEVAEFADVTCCESVSAALDEVRRGRRFDVVVVDLRMPDRWGDELLAHIAASSPGTRRLVFTGDYEPEQTMRELLARGVIHACYRKPSVAAVLAALRGAVA